MLSYSLITQIQPQLRVMHHFSKKTKIVATIGPGSENKETLTTLFQNGVDVCRTNMSHDDQVIHEKRIKLIRSVAKKEGLPIAILVDLSGPKIRIGDFVNAPVELVAGKKLILSGDKNCQGDVTRVYFNYPHIEKDIKAGMILMLDDGKKKVVVEKVVGTEIHTKILVGGVTKSRRGVNIPGAYLSIPAMTEKDKKDLSFGIAQGADFVATGHYARVTPAASLSFFRADPPPKTSGDPHVQKREDAAGAALHKGRDENKDQSYFLWTLTKEKLAKQGK